MNKETIYREDAIDEMERIMADHPLQGYEDELLLIDAIKSLPSADRPQGEWIDKGGYAICSNCRAHSEVQYDGVPVPLKTRYCPDCGYRMKGADDE